MVLTFCECNLSKRVQSPQSLSVEPQLIAQVLWFLISLHIWVLPPSPSFPTSLHPLPNFSHFQSWNPDLAYFLALNMQLNMPRIVSPLPGLANSQPSCSFPSKFALSGKHLLTQSGQIEGPPQWFHSNLCTPLPWPFFALGFLPPD